MLSFNKLLYILLLCSLLYFPSVSGWEGSAWMKHAQMAEELQEKKQYDEASGHWEKAYRLADNESDSVKNWLLFKQLYAKGVGFNYDKEGIPFFEKAYPLLPYSRLDTSAQSTFLNTYYHFLGYNNRWEEALPHAQECMRLRELLNENPPLAYLSAVHDLAFINNKIGNYPEAITYYQQSIDGYIQYAGDASHDVALGYNNLAFNYGLVGMANKQYESYLKASAIWSNMKLADNSYLLTLYGNILRWQRQYGDHVAMEGTLAKIREVIDGKSAGWGSQNRLLENKSDDMNPKPVLTYWKSCLDYHLVKKDRDGVQAYLDSTKRFIAQLPGRPGDEWLEYLNNANSVLGEVNAELGHHDEAIRAYHAGIAQMEAYGYTGAMAHTYAKLAKSLLAADQLDAAGHYIEQALGGARNQSDLPLFHTLSAQLAEKRLQPDSVRYHVGETLANLTRNDALSPDYTQLTSASFHGRVSRHYIASLSTNGHLLLQLYRDSGTPDDLRNAQHLFALALEMLNTYYLGGPYTDALADMQSAIHFGLLECQTLRQQQPDSATLAILFENLENNRSQHRWKKFIKHAPANSTTVPDSLREAEEELRQLLVFYKHELASMDKDSLNGKQANQWRAKIHSSEELLATVENQLLALNDRYMKLSQGMLTTATLQRALPKQTSMLRYMFTDSGAYVMQIDRSALSLFPLGRTDSIERLAQQAIAELHTRSPDYYRTAAQLHARLLGPAIVRGLEPNLIIVPDGVLHQLPFEALTNNANPAGFLLHRHNISYAASTSLWLAQQGVRHGQKRPFGAFAPDYAGPAGEERSATAQRLTGAAKEAQAIAEMLEGNLYQANHFGKTDFITEAPHYSLLHLAMHADVREEDSERSSFQFGDGSKLYAYELYGLKLQANMAVLSACNTGYGPVQKGEGVQSLAMAFTYAGVPSLVMGLWSLPDASTGDIMVDYYRELVDKKHKHTALAAAKANYLTRVDHESELQHPFYWAGLVVSGDINPIHSPHLAWYWIAAIGFILVAVTVLGMRLGRRRRAEIR